jgi:flagellar basal body-associated protein FliL
MKVLGLTNAISVRSHLLRNAILRSMRKDTKARLLTQGKNLNAKSEKKASLNYTI